jgi:NTE family protein/lysophospholipid hydrolase
LLGTQDADVLRFVEARARWLQRQAGETLFVEGDRGDDLYLIIAGRLRAERADGTILGEITRGDTVGEIAMITGEPRSATVTVVRDTQLIAISRVHLEEIVARYPRVMQAIARVVANRLLARERATTRPASGLCITLLTIGASPPAEHLAARLVSALSRLGTTLHLSSARVDAMLGRPGTAQVDHDSIAGIRLTSWLGEQEVRHRFVVYVVDGEDTPWSRLCLRHADEILLLGQAASAPRPTGVELTLLRDGNALSRARQTLVLAHPAGSPLPSNTASWLAGRPVKRHYHIRSDRDEDFARVARCVTGSATGVVFGGGGARGLAHIGVVRALVEAGVPMDAIGGTSMGAVIASGFGMGHDWREVLEISRTGWLRHKPHKEYTLPMISLIGTRGLDRWARDVCGTANIEDLWLSFYCISCNLTRGEIAVLDRGPLWKAIRASSALPGIFVPVLIDGQVFVDGGIVNNLPGDIMRNRDCRNTIVIDVGMEIDVGDKLTDFPSPWQYLWSRIVPRGPRIQYPNIATLLIRGFEVGSVQKTNEVKRDADLYLRPPIETYGVLEFEAIDQIVEVGYRYTQERLAQMDRDGTLRPFLG